MLVRLAVSIFVTVMSHLLVFQGSSGNLSLSTVAVVLGKTSGLYICSLLSALNITQTFLLSWLVFFLFLFLFSPFSCTGHILRPILCKVGKSEVSKLAAISKAKTPPVSLVWTGEGTEAHDSPLHWASQCMVSHSCYGVALWGLALDSLTCLISQPPLETKEIKAGLVNYFCHHY